MSGKEDEAWQRLLGLSPHTFFGRISPTTGRLLRP